MLEDAVQEARNDVNTANVAGIDQVEHNDTEREAYHHAVESLIATTRQHAAYKTNTEVGKRRALANHYPLVSAYLGEALFGPIAAVYAQHVPSRQWDINLYGDQFHTFLSAQMQGPRSEVANWAFAAALAEFEYVLLQCYYTFQDEKRSQNVSNLAFTAMDHGMFFEQLQALSDLFPLYYPWCDLTALFEKGEATNERESQWQILRRFDADYGEFTVTLRIMKDGIV